MSFEMERMLPGADPADVDSDPIFEACEQHAAGNTLAAEKILIEMLATDLRCLDAHSHLGSFVFAGDPEKDVRIGELSQGDDFDGVLPCGRINNRPFLRCMHGLGLGLWRLGRHEKAAAVFERMLWLNLADNVGIRFLLRPVRRGAQWEDH